MHDDIRLQVNAAISDYPDEVPFSVTDSHKARLADKVRYTERLFVLNGYTQKSKQLAHKWYRPKWLFGGGTYQMVFARRSVTL